MGNDIQMLLEGIGEELGRPLRLPPLPVDLEPFPNQGSKPNLFGSSVAINGRHYLLQDHTKPFLTEAPDGYLVLGLWGYGINSYAFYYCSVTPEARIFVRLPYGGVYMGDREAAALPAFFEHFTPFIERVRPLVSSLQLVESMGHSFRRFDLRFGCVLEETKPSLYDNIEEWDRLWARVSGSVGKVAENHGGKDRTGEVGMPAAPKARDFRSQILGRQLAWRKTHLPELDERGKWQGKYYDHILPASQWTKNLWPGIEKSLPRYLDEEGIQPHLGKDNLLSSWALGASLYFPFGQDENGRALLADFLNKTVDSRIQTVTGVALEFVDDGRPATKHLLGERGGKRGANQTSPDVGVRVGLEEGAEGLVLIEVKFCESDFSSCSARRRELKPQGRQQECDDLAEVLGDPDKRCAQYRCYERRYFHHLAGPLRAAAAARSTRCPAAVNGYQLFRQQALAEALANCGRYEMVASALAYHEGNEHLAMCLGGIGLPAVGQWGSLFDGRANFVAFTHQAWVKHVADSPQGEAWRPWVDWAASRYGFPGLD